MNDKLALRLLSEVMGWQNDDSTAAREYQWLRLMGASKYDGYSDFKAGVRFLESFATWLKQFEPQDRQAAYKFVKQRLIYISFPELQCLIEAFIPEIVTPLIRSVAAEELGIRPFEIWRTAAGEQRFRDRFRKVLFVGMSDGARIDYLRRANSKLLSTEQVVPMMNIDTEKWSDLHEKLEEDCGKGARFDHVFLIDDFTASGTTFIREKDKSWKGKLTKFNKLIRSASPHDSFPIAPNYHLHIHHYVSSYQARRVLDERIAHAHTHWADKSFGSIDITEGLLLPETAKLDAVADEAILALCEKYYDHALFERLKKHCLEAGQTTMMHGYADCALPIVLDHNTPNNSIPLLWAETAGATGVHAMLPLFFRRDRHG